MRCSVCQGESFIASEYILDDRRAPAVECTRCHALDLDEAMARSQEERDSVRLAVAARAACCEDPAAKRD